MVDSKKTLRICKLGHKYYKSSTCPVCPVCEKTKKNPQDFLPLISAPARRALEHEGIKTLQALSTYSESKLLSLHGVGPAAIPKLKKTLSENKLTFSK